MKIYVAATKKTFMINLIIFGDSVDNRFNKKKNEKELMGSEAIKIKLRQLTPLISSYFVCAKAVACVSIISRGDFGVLR